VLFTWATWRLGAVRWAFLLLNIGMAASAMIIGAHYLVDLIGGAFVAAFALCIARHLSKVLAGEEARVSDPEPMGLVVDPTTRADAWNLHR
jgi:hypothetical protein